MPRVFQHEALRDARLELNLTQEQAAAAIGIDVRTYRRYEAGEVNDPTAGFEVRHPSRRRILERMVRELGVAMDELLGDVSSPPPQAPPEPSWTPRLVHALQPARHFVGRSELLATLERWRQAPDAHPRVIALIGPGGAGKTSVVERLVSAIRAPQQGGVFVWSFYEDPRADAFVDRALAYFEGAKTPLADERCERLQLALQSGLPHLLVLDGLEVLQASWNHQRAQGELFDPLIRRLLMALARGLGKSRALVTSRFRIEDLDAWEGQGFSTLRPAPLSQQESTELLQAWGIRANATELASLGQRTGGHPLSLAMLGSYVGGFLGGQARLAEELPLELAARDDALARRLQNVLEAYAKALPEATRDVLVRLSIFASGAGVDRLFELLQSQKALAGALATASRTEILGHLRRLEELGLVFRLDRDERDERYSAHPFVRDYFRSLLGQDERALHQAEHDRLVASLERSPATQSFDRSALDAWEEIYHHALSAGDVEEAYAIYTRGFGGFDHLGLRLGDMARGERMLRELAGGNEPTSFPEALSQSWRIRLCYEWGLYSGALGNLAFAVRCYRSHNAWAEASESTVNLMTGLRTLAYTYRLAGKLKEATEACEASMALAEAEKKTAHIARASALHGAILHDLGEIVRAREAFARVRDLGDEPIARRLLWESELRLELGEYERAWADTEQNLAHCVKLRWDGHAAHCHTLLGRLCISMGRGEARAHLAEARRWTSRTGELEMVLRALELELELLSHEGDFRRMRELARQGICTAESAGFLPFARRFEKLLPD